MNTVCTILTVTSPAQERIIMRASSRVTACKDLLFQDTHSRPRPTFKDETTVAGRVSVSFPDSRNHGTWQWEHRRQWLAASHSFTFYSFIHVPLREPLTGGVLSLSSSVLRAERRGRGKGKGPGLGLGSDMMSNLELCQWANMSAMV